MGDTGIKFNDRKTREFFQNIGNNIDDIKRHDKVYWGAISAVAFRDVIKHFESELGPGGKWKKWSDLYRKHMQRTGKAGNKILQDSGRMRQSTFLASTSTRIKKGQLLYNPAKTKGGFAYAEAHNEGTKKLPKREFMWLSERAMGKISKITANYTLKGV